MTVERPDYELRVDHYEGHAWMHATVRRWSHHVARALRDDVATLCAAQASPMLATATAACASGAPYDVWRKFVALNGFRFLMTKTDAQGVRHAIYRR